MHLAKMQMQRPSAFSITRTPPTGKTPNKKKMQCKQCVRYIFRLVKHCSCSHVGQGGMSHCFNFLVDGGAAHEFEPCWTLGSLACHKLKISPWHATVIAFSTAQEGKKTLNGIITVRKNCGRRISQTKTSNSSRTSQVSFSHNLPNHDPPAPNAT